jgi:transposase, IS5 family
MKSDGKLGRNYLKGKEGDRNNAILVGIGHNLRIILRKLRVFSAQFFLPATNCSLLEVLKNTKKCD